MNKIMVFFLSVLAVIVTVIPFGNPISEFLVTKNAEIYLEENYSGTDYFIEDVTYDFKTGNYYVSVSSPESPDSSFTIYSDLKGKIGYDTYEDAVLNKWNTAGRIDDAYRESVKKVLESGSLPYDISIGFGEIVYKESGVPVGETVPDYAIAVESLVLDGEYDTAEMGKKAGKLTVYIYSEKLTEEKLAEVLLTIRKATDKGGVYFKAIDCVLEYPQPEDGGQWRDERIAVENFMYDDIYEDGLVGRIKENIG